MKRRHFATAIAVGITVTAVSLTIVGYAVLFPRTEQVGTLARACRDPDHVLQFIQYKKDFPERGGWMRETWSSTRELRKACGSAVVLSSDLKARICAGPGVCFAMMYPYIGFTQPDALMAFFTQERPPKQKMFFEVSEIQ